MAAKPSYADDIYNPITEIEDLYQGDVNDEEYDLLVFIGRFQPFHLGHRRVVDIALRKAKRVLILAGSADRPRRPRNPWTWEERREMIRAAFPYVPKAKLIVEPLLDFAYRDELWISYVQQAVADVAQPGDRIGMIGCSKDNSSYYLKLFPQWGNVNVRFLNPLNATEIREAFFMNIGSSWNRVKGRDGGAIVLDQGVTDWLTDFKWVKGDVTARQTQEYQEVKAYMEACKASYQSRQKGAKYPVQDLAADALVTQSGHILLVERNNPIGNLLEACPGGYVNENETFLDAAIRELKEETNLRVPVPVLKGSLIQTFVADDPYRSERGRIISIVHHFKLNDQILLPEVRGGSDAGKAFWKPIGELSPETMFEDHWDFASKLLNI